MDNKFLSLIILFLGFIGFFYPTERENTKLLDYCFSLEKILAKNTIDSKENISQELKLLSKGLIKFGIENSRGELSKKIIDSYKTSKNNIFIDFIPTNIYCLSGYWIEKFKPGTFEYFLAKETKGITKFKYKNMKKDLGAFESFIDDLNIRYDLMMRQFKNF